jgi:hypothetical protein
MRLVRLDLLPDLGDLYVGGSVGVVGRSLLIYEGAVALLGQGDRTALRILDRVSGAGIHLGRFRRQSTLDPR